MNWKKRKKHNELAKKHCCGNYKEYKICLQQWCIVCGMSGKSRNQLLKEWERLDADQVCDIIARYMHDYYIRKGNYWKAYSWLSQMPPMTSDMDVEEEPSEEEKYAEAIWREQMAEDHRLEMHEKMQEEMQKDFTDAIERATDRVREETARFKPLPPQLRSIEAFTEFMSNLPSYVPPPKGEWDEQMKQAEEFHRILNEEMRRK